MNELIDEVLSKDIDTKEKYRISEIKVKSLLTVGKVNESINTALDFNRQLGLPAPQKKAASKFTIIREYIRVKKLLKGKTAEDIAHLPELDDELFEMGQRMNEHLATSVYLVEPTMYPLIIFQSVTTSLKHGLNSSSSPAFARLGMLLCGPFGKPHEGLEMAKAAELILERPGMRSSTSNTPGYYCTITEGVSGRMYYLFFTGRTLDSIQKELEAAANVMTQLKQEENKLKITILLSSVKKLRGLDPDASDKMLDSILASAAETRNNLSAYVNVMKLE
eukprot:scaffold18212_cov73-Skeletonema_marinoi.AAC.1